jgi:hypothetical protein
VARARVARRSIVPARPVVPVAVERGDVLTLGGGVTDGERRAAGAVLG